MIEEYTVAKEINYPALFEGAEVGTFRYVFLLITATVEFKVQIKNIDKEDNQVKRYFK